MTLVLVDGFDTYNGTGSGTGSSSVWSSFGATLVAGRFGGQALDHYYDTSNGNRASTRALPSTYSSLCIGVAMRFVTFYPNPANHGANIMLMNSGAYQCSVRVTNSGEIQIIRSTGDSSYVLISSTLPGVVKIDAWHYIEMETVVNNTTGSMNVYLDGTSVLSVSGVNLANAGNIGVNQIRLGCVGQSTGNLIAHVQFDDLYVNDTNTRVGERRITTLYPNSDVSQGWSRSTGSTNYTLVDETLANGDTDYVTANTVGTVDTYTFGDMSYVPLNIDAVNMIAYARKSDATTKAISLQMVSNTTTVDGSNFNLTGNTYIKTERIVTTDPHTAGSWTIGNVNNLKGGPKITT